MKLSDFIASIAYKKLVPVDLPNRGSNQHEVNGVETLRQFFEGETSKGALAWHFLADGREPAHGWGNFSFYDARRNDRSRSAEWRLYYSGDFASIASPDDVLVLVRTTTGEIHALIFEAGSTWLQAAQALMLPASPQVAFGQAPAAQLPSGDLDYYHRRFLEELELGFSPEARPTDIDLVRERFDSEFPTTRAMSDFARSHAGDQLDDPDGTLLSWLTREEELFLALESLIVLDKVTGGFSSVDEFVGYSLTVQNRRKARMGYALQNHLAALFDRYMISYTPQPHSFAQGRPDFLFPGEREYGDERFDPSRLTVLAAKSTLKERWRQVLSEAPRIQQKHLCTVDPSLSRSQVAEIHAAGVVLVMPRGGKSSLHTSAEERTLTLGEFLDLVIDRQSALGGS